MTDNQTITTNRNKNNANLNIPSLFTVGEIVKIDNDTTAYIIEIRGEKFDYFFKVKYIIDNRIESNVSEHRCTVVSINEKNTSTRSGRVNRHFDAPTISCKQALAHK